MINFFYYFTLYFFFHIVSNEEKTSQKPFLLLTAQDPHETLSVMLSERPDDDELYAYL